MKKLLDSLKFLAKASLLVLLLLVGWAFVNVTNLVKGKKSQEKGTGLTGVFGTNQADADAPPAPPKATTPFLAYFDGKGYKLENDILFGRPNSFHHLYDTAKTLYEDGRIFPDLYKITSPIKPYNGKLLFQIQEIEPEESFFKWMELTRVIHPKNTEVVVDSDFKKFYVLGKDQIEGKMVLPLSAIDDHGKDRVKEISNPDLLWQYNPSSGENMLFNASEGAEITFKNLRKGEIPYLVTKTWFRDWVAGETFMRVADKKISALDFFTASGLRKVALVVALFISSWIHYKFGFVPESLAFLPVVFGSETPGDPPPGPCTCLTYGYKDEDGECHWINISDVRSWKYNNEVVELPREAVNSRGELALRVMATKRHALGFIGVVQEGDLNVASYRDYRTEKLGLSRVYHNRLQKDVSGALRKGYWKEYAHTIPGDTIDLEFSAPSSGLRENERETYLLRSSGFYTSLRPEYRKLAGNWQDKVSAEARSRFSSLVPLSTYR